jgi:glycosyltransferase involved in cell wall biosynthesis
MVLRAVAGVTVRRMIGIEKVDGRCPHAREGVMDQPLVSVIVPTYNYGRFIGQTLESVQAQTYGNWECIVVDDGSTDDTPEVVGRYVREDGRFKYLRQRNQRQGAAKNNGIQNSVGKYFQFLDADDLIEPKKLERQAEFLDKHPDVDIVYGSVRFFSTENLDQRLHSMWGANRPWMPGLSGEGKDILMALTRANIMAVNSPLVRRSVIEKVGLFDEKLPPAEDWDYWIRCAAAGMRFTYEDFEGTLALVRSHPLSSSKDNRSWLSASLLLRMKVPRTIADQDVRQLNAEFIAENEGLLGVQEVLHGSLAKGVYRLFKAGVMDRGLNHKAKWLISALSAPILSKKQFNKIHAASLTGAVRAAIKQQSIY